MLATLRSISNAEKAVTSDIQHAAQKADWNVVDVLTRTGKRLTELKAELSAHSNATRTATLSHFDVQVTSGAIEYKYLAATPGIRAHAFRVGQAVTLKLGAREISTVVLKYGRFRDRKNVAKYYAE